MDSKWLFPHLNGANYHSWVDQMTALLQSKGLWMYLARLLPVEDDDNYDLICLKKDEALGLITLYVKPDLIHHTKDNKSVKGNLGYLQNSLWNGEYYSGQPT
jgi:hypothetical protein